MAFVAFLERIRSRILQELLENDTIPDVDPPTASFPSWWTAADRADEATATSTSTTADTKLRILSLNAWGIPVLTPKTTERAAELAKAITAADDFDLVVLQEIWHVRERNTIILRAQQAGFAYHHYFNPAVGFPVPFGPDSFGTGLLVVSKIPIETALYHSYSLTGRPFALHEADFIANKGVGLLRRRSQAGPIDLYVTHLIANYAALGKPGPEDFYLAHRAGQAYELAQFITATSRAPLVVVAGDFNSSPDCLELRLPQQLNALRDAFSDTNDSPGLTFATEDNKYSHGDHPMRMDYVLYKIARDRETAVANDATDRPRWHLTRSRVFKSFFTDKHGDKCPLSDHFGVQVEFVFSGSHVHACDQQEYAVVGRDGSTLSPTAAGASAKPVENGRACKTTTCAHCDEWDGDPKGASSAEMLVELRRVLAVGRERAAAQRLATLQLASALLVACVSVAVVRWWQFVSPMWSLAVVLLLGLGALGAYLLAFFFLTFECSAFTELGNQARLHLSVEQARSEPNAS